MVPKAWSTLFGIILVSYECISLFSNLTTDNQFA